MISIRRALAGALLVAAAGLGARAAWASQRGDRALITASEAPSYKILGGKGEATLYFNASTGSPQAALDKLTLQAGAEIPRHQHEKSDELLYVESGELELTLFAGEPVTLHAKAGDALHIRAGTDHAGKALAATTAIQVYTPPGPEQRFAAPPKK